MGKHIQRYIHDPYNFTFCTTGDELKGVFTMNQVMSN